MTGAIAVIAVIARHRRHRKGKKIAVIALAAVIAEIGNTKLVSREFARMDANGGSMSISKYLRQSWNRIDAGVAVRAEHGQKMRFYTKDECEEWLSGRARQKPDALPEALVERVSYPTEAHRTFFFAHWIARSVTYQQPTLLWITEWGIWPSSENWHLYYKLRHSYGDLRLLHEAPGHLFLEHEAEDLTSFLHIAMLNGWGGYMLTHANYVNVFFSHDEYVDFFAKLDMNLREVREEFGVTKRGRWHRQD